MAKAKVTPFVLKNLKAKEFEALLVNHGACGMAREWAKGKSLKQAFKSCPNFSWIDWLLWRMTAKTGYAPITGNEYTHSRKEIAAWGGRRHTVRAFLHAAKTANKWYANPKTTSRKSLLKEVKAAYNEYYTVA